jgi:hypothetical protein
MEGTEVSATEFHDVPLLESDAELESILSEMNFLAQLEIEDDEATAAEFARVPDQLLDESSSSVQLFEEWAEGEEEPAEETGPNAHAARLPEDLDELARDLRPVTPPAFSRLWLRRRLRGMWRGGRDRSHWVWFAFTMVALLGIFLMLARMRACEPAQPTDGTASGARSQSEP